MCGKKSLDKNDFSLSDAIFDQVEIRNLKIDADSVVLLVSLQIDCEYYIVIRR